MKGLLPAGHEGVPRGFGLRTGDRGDTAGGAGDCGRPAQLSILGGTGSLAELQTAISFPAIQCP